MSSVRPDLPHGPVATVTGSGGRAALLGRVRRPLVVAAGLAAGTALLAVRDPHVPGSYSLCPLHAATGLWCPACGCLRATHDLAHGDLAGAWGMNPLWVLAVPVVAALWVRWFSGAAVGRTLRPIPVRAGWVGLTVVLVFGVLRNVPALAPSLAP